MLREYHKWYSPALGRPMELLSFGHAGATVVAFPTSRGTFHEWEDKGLIRALAGRIDAGHFRLVCLDSVDAESWYAFGKPAADRARRQAEYDAYVVYEVLPFVHSRTADHYVIAAGASFGAFHALSLALRHPARVNRVVSMSGLCDIRWFADGYSDTTLFHLNPVQFVPGEHDPARLADLRRQDIILAVGKGDRLAAQNRALSAALWAKGVGNALREWDGFAHDWPVWDKMLNLYVGGHD